MARKGGASLQRKVGRRTPKKRVLVVSEGEKTEPQYLKLINHRTRKSLVELVLIDEPATSPKKLVERACQELKNSKREVRKTGDPNAGIDEIWCVFDVDDHLYLKEAKQQAEVNGVLVTISNPSFEIWFLLHFEDCSAYIHRDAVTRRLRDYIPAYDKHVRNLDALEGKYDSAKSRAQFLAAKHCGDRTEFPDDNPSTNIWELIESIEARY